MFITSITNLPGYARLKNASIYFICLFVYLFTYLLGIYLFIYKVFIYLFIKYLFTYLLSVYLLSIYLFILHQTCEFKNHFCSFDEYK